MKKNVLSVIIAWAIVSSICLSSVLFSQPKKYLTLEDIFSSTLFSQKSLPGLRWLPDESGVSFQQYDSTSKATAIFVYSLKENQRKLIISGADLKLSPNDPIFRFTSYQWSPDGNSILFISAPPEKQYLSRLTPAGNLFLYDVGKRLFRRLTNVTRPQFHPKFSPDSKQLGFVRDNNIFVIDLKSEKEIQLTQDGGEHLINGKFDWVYEEEFSISDGWQWSPDGTSIAYWQVDENRVPEYTLTEWDSLHLTLIPMRYPKPGDKNSIVKIGVIKVATGTTTWMDIGENDDIYIPRIKWTSDPSRLSVQRMNRKQNRLDLLLCDIAVGTSRILLTEQSDAWIDINDGLTFLNDKSFFWLSQRDGFTHLYHFDANGKLLTQVTQGNWEITAVNGVDDEKQTVYFTSTENSPLERRIYKIKFNGKKKELLTAETGTHTAICSPGKKYFIDTYSSVTSRNKIRVLDNTGKTVTVLERNEHSKYDEFALGTTELFTFTTSDGIVLNASLTKPADFDSSKKYPVLFYVYGGPNSQLVTNAWGNLQLWFSYLNQNGYLVFSVDGRGTGGRGRAFAYLSYKKLGEWEVLDQIEGAKFLSTLPYVDSGRLGVYGWSYGGYTSALALLKGADYFKTAVAVAPVTDWRYYDDIYTERYMSLPTENQEGYRNASLLTHASKLKGNLLLIHGTSDDNVHFQNTANFITALQKAGKQFDLMIYPNKNHGISIGNSRLNVYTKITNYILEHL